MGMYINFPCHATALRCTRMIGANRINILFLCGRDYARMVYGYQPQKAA